MLKFFYILLYSFDSAVTASACSERNYSPRMLLSFNIFNIFRQVETPFYFLTFFSILLHLYIELSKNKC